MCAIAWVDDNGAVTVATSSNGVVWDTHQIPDQQPATRWQAQIASNANDQTQIGPSGQDFLAVTWYEQPPNDANTSVMASISKDGGFNWSPPSTLTIGVPWRPCVTGGHWFGDYMGLTALAYDSPNFIATWADSRKGCIPGEYGVDTLVAQHMHTMSNTFVP